MTFKIFSAAVLGRGLDANVPQDRLGCANVLIPCARSARIRYRVLVVWSSMIQQMRLRNRR